MPIPTDLEVYQQDLSVDTLYYVKNSGKGTERQNSGLSVDGGTVNVYGSLHKPASAPADMILDRGAFSGLDSFAWVPTYLYFEDNTGTPVVTVSSIEAEEVV